jgi:hypothetical protein
MHEGAKSLHIIVTYYELYQAILTTDVFAPVPVEYPRYVQTYDLLVRSKGNKKTTGKLR